MASPSAPQHEPTMEEILASIRKIISEDSSEQPAVSETGLEPAEDADVLELTQEITLDEPTAEPEPGALVAAPVEDAHLDDDVVFEEIEEPTMNEATAPDEGIFSDKTRSALDDAFAGLDNQAPARAPAYAPPEGSSVEAVFERAVRNGFEPLLREHLDANTGAIIENMKPLIREWMDEHFPSLLENAVRNEVARAVKARDRR
jgi:cell pole-organizing protein PopZ